MAYQYQQHPNYNNHELAIMDYSAVSGKAVNAVGIVPTQKVVESRAPEPGTETSGGRPWSQGYQGQLVAGAGVLALLWFLQ